jgi:CubicO group peptidase (beta-lactamase class C family)
MPFEESKAFFFKKKKQKTLGNFGSGPAGEAQPRCVRVFWFFFSKKNFLLSACLAFTMAKGIAQAQVPAETSPALVAAPAAAAQTGHALTQDDLSAFLDGFMPYAMKRGEVAGAVVVVVKDGQPLLQRGYGLADVATRKPVDPDNTLFRPGSVSKLFTWTAVMQLVQAGKIDLDSDINTYLDFKIPAAFGKPITMRNLMTHAAGFSDAAKDLIGTDPASMPGLEAALKAAVPERLFPPGTVPAYSNYGAALAGYVVQRLSGEPFTVYIANHILKPLGMSHSTFEQPLPKPLAPDMSSGYNTASGPAQAFELVEISPAGGLSASGADMGKFMLAQLQDGTLGAAHILDAKTAQLMHSPQFQPVPPLTAMDLGFYQEPGNGHRVIGHAGDTQFFHSDLHLYLDDHVGLYLSMNSAGAAGAAHAIREALFKDFTDRYFPAPPDNDKTSPTAVQDGHTLTGYYVLSRRSDSGWFRIANYLLGEAHITSTADGIVTVSSLMGIDEQPKQWREVGPFVYRQVGGDSRLAAVVHNGTVVAVATDDLPPVMEFQPVSIWMSAWWNLPLFIATLVILSLTVLFWPVAGLVRRRYRQTPAFPRFMLILYRLTRVVALADLLFFAGWLVLLQLAETHIELLSTADDWVLRVIQAFGAIGVVGAIFPAVFALLCFVLQSRRGWWTKLSSVAVALACVASVWFAFSLNLLTQKLVY